MSHQIILNERIITHTHNHIPLKHNVKKTKIKINKNSQLFEVFRCGEPTGVASFDWDKPEKFCILYPKRTQAMESMVGL